MKHHAWALVPLTMGLILQFAGFSDALLLGTLGTAIGVAISCAAMAYETGGAVSAIIRFHAVLFVIACGAVLGGHLASTESENPTSIAEPIHKPA